MQIREILETMEYGPAPEATEPVLTWLKERNVRFGLYIDGRWSQADGASYFQVVNPANDEQLAHVTQARPEDVDAAVRAARKAFPKWSRLSGHARARYLYGLARQIQKHARFFAVLESLDNGKPIREARDIDIPLVARHFYHHAGWAQLLHEEFPDYEPIGVAGQIIPWNFPLLMLAWKIAPALAAGNTVVLKPAEFTPLTALAFAELCSEVGLPPGVVNIVTGDGEVGKMIVDHPDVDKIAFTGSTEVGRLIRRQTAGSGKRLTLELGGKSPFIVFDDADVDSAIEGIVDAIWFNQGEVCCAGSRLLVQENLAETFVSRLKARMEKLRVGDPIDRAIDIGAVVSRVQLKRIEELVEQGKREADFWQPSWSGSAKGCFYPPTLFTNVPPTAVVFQEEIFGPVLATTTFRTPDEAVALANNTRYGLAASIWTENINLALDVAAKVKAGVVWVNSTNMFDAAAGFGGYRESGYGREGGREGLWEYLRPTWEKGVRSAPHDSGDALATKRGKGGKRGDGTVEDLPAAGMNGEVASARFPLMDRPLAAGEIVPIDRTPKMYIGGKQVRPDAPYPRHILSPQGRWIGEVGEGNRKDIRNAVEAAHKATGWGRMSAHQRAQVMYYLAENLSVRSEEFAQRIADMMDRPIDDARQEVALTIDRLFTYGSWADKYEGVVHRTVTRNVTLAMPEPIGVIGIGCPDEYPLLAFVSLVAPAIAVGNTVVAVPSPSFPLAATDFYQVLDTSDVPGGVVNIVTGDRNELVRVLAEHDDVDSVWYMGDADGSAMVERCSTGNMKRTWVNYGRQRDWTDGRQGAGQEFLREATQIKNIWVPYGE